MEEAPPSPDELEPAWNADPRLFTQDFHPLSPSAQRALWLPSRFQPACLEIRSRCVRSGRGPGAEVAVPVLVATSAGRASPWAGQSLLASRQRVDWMYQVEHAQMKSIFDLEARCGQQAPRLVLVDIALVSPERVDRLDDLRRRLPATDWLLGWEAPSMTGLDAAIRSQARGCVEWTASAEQFAQSLDVVLMGILGFPGPVLQALYLSVLRSKAAGGPASPCAISPANRLTAREDEVLSLMHRDMTNKQIAERLGISVNTVKKHLAHVFAKQGQHSRRRYLA